MYIYNYFIILLSICISYDIRFDTIHDTKKSKIDSRFDNYECKLKDRNFSVLGMQLIENITRMIPHKYS